jgi:hypothetical protein
MIVYRKRRRNRSRSRKRSRARSRRNPRFGLHHPALYFGKSGWRRKRTKRSRGSRLIKRGTRINPRRRRRFNPSMGALVPSKQFLMQAASMVLGYTAGKMLMGQLGGLVAKLPIPAGPNQSKMIAAVNGALTIAIGSIAGAKLKGDLLRNVGVGVAASGLVTIISAFLPDLKLGTDLDADLGTDFDGEGGVVRVGDDMVRVAEDESVDGESAYERV